MGVPSHALSLAGKAPFDFAQGERNSALTSRSKHHGNNLAEK